MNAVSFTNISYILIDFWHDEALNVKHQTLTGYWNNAIDFTRFERGERVLWILTKHLTESDCMIKSNWRWCLRSVVFRSVWIISINRKRINKRKEIIWNWWTWKKCYPFTCMEFISTWLSFIDPYAHIFLVSLSCDDAQRCSNVSNLWYAQAMTHIQMRLTHSIFVLSYFLHSASLVVHFKNSPLKTVNTRNNFSSGIFGTIKWMLINFKCLWRAYSIFMHIALHQREKLPAVIKWQEMNDFVLFSFRAIFMFRVKKNLSFFSFSLAQCVCIWNMAITINHDTSSCLFGFFWSKESKFKIFEHFFPLFAS